MHIFHDWNKWSEVIIETWAKQRIIVGGVPIGEPINYERVMQERTCKICGKYQKRYVKEKS